MSSLDLYNEVSAECSKGVTKMYSTSFSSGIRLFHKSIRSPIYSIYGFVRIADEIVDTFHDYNQQTIFDHFRDNLRIDFKNGISTNPVLNAYIQISQKYDIPMEYTEAFLDSMEMDLEMKTFTREEYDRYIYGSAEVIGLMCLKVFTHHIPEEFEKLKFSAQKLGAAFQKINFLRDFKSDLKERGRVYFPNIKGFEFDQTIKKDIEKEISNDFDSALQGIMELPKEAKLGVFIAYNYYRKLLNKLVLSKPEEIQASRIRVGDFRKFVILGSTVFKYKTNLL